MAKTNEIWWVTSKHSYVISPVRVKSFTAKTITVVSVWGNERRTPISSEWNQFYPTANEAVEAIKKRCKQNIKNAELEIAECKKRLAELATFSQKKADKVIASFEKYEAEVAASKGKPLEV